MKYKRATALCKFNLFLRTRSVFYPLGSLTAETNPQQHRMLTSLSSLSFILWIQPRLLWCNNPTGQYATLVLALINWGCANKRLWWAERGVRTVIFYSIIFLSCLLLMNLPADLKMYLDAFLISSCGKCLFLTDCVSWTLWLRFAKCYCVITKISCK